MKLSLLALLGALSVPMGLSSTHPLSRHVEIMNQSGRNMKVYWIDPRTGEEVQFTARNTVYNGASFSVNSFVNHTLMVREMPTNGANETCGDESCHVNYVTVSENEGEQIVFVKEGLEIDFVDSKKLAKAETSDALEHCKTMKFPGLDSLPKEEAESQKMKLLVKCIEDSVTEKIMEKNEEISFQAKTREAVANQLENYTCADNDLPTTTAQEIRTWDHKGTEREVHVLHNRESSQIHVVKNFISEEECDAIMEAAKPKLHRGTVADGAGGSKLSDHRKAWQAGVAIPWDKEEEGDPIAQVTRRIYDYANHVNGYGLEVEGQEELMSIQYFGNGGEGPPDQYRPHCDGDCDGLPHKTGGRIATMVMYCTVPDKGGSTNFGHAGVHVKPELGAAAFFSYMNPKTYVTEKGFTTHSGCPVIEGTKRIAVQWMRLGVDKENPWDSFNTLTVKRGQEEEDC